ncbi:MAG: RidA family protein [Eubacteriaceae bacterium]
MNKKAINSSNAPAAVGPYSHSYLVGETLYISGQLGLDPITGEMAAGVEAQARQALKNLSAILETAGLTERNIVKTTIFLSDMADFALVNEIYADYFKDVKEFPARSCVQVAALPKNGAFEMEAIAVK